jgi:hypothetical protein
MDVGGEPQEDGAISLMEMRLPNNDSVEPFIGNEGVGIRGDKPRPIAIAGDCCPLFGDIDGLRRSIDSNNQARRTNQPGDQERGAASTAFEFENTHAALDAGPLQDVFGKVLRGDDP